MAMWCLGDALGKMVSVFAIVVGFAMIALPVAIVSTAVRATRCGGAISSSLGMLRGCRCSRILVLPTSRHHAAVARATIERAKSWSAAADAASSMYFITAGRGRDRPAEQARRLSDGTFFGEIALLKRPKAQRTVTRREKPKAAGAPTPRFHALIERLPALAAHVRNRGRRLADTEEAAGAIIAEGEIAQPDQ